MNLLSYLSSIITVSQKLEKEIQSLFSIIEVDKGAFLIKQDERCSDMYFIQKGLIRGYYNEDGKEITSWFAQEGEFATCFYSFISNKPSFENVQTVEKCELIKITNTTLQNLYLQFPETERIGRIIVENYYLKLDERFLNVQFKSAKERYQNLILSKPSLLQRASLGQIASYLGISQETLSRIRAEM